MYDLTIIGSGWAGFNAALRARELGLNVCLVEAGELGGTCLNLGCIPTKTLIQSAKVFSLINKARNFGIETTGQKINFNTVQERKEKIIKGLRSGMQSLLKGIDFLHAQAQILNNEEIKAGDITVKSKAILIATGSKPAQLGGFKFDGKRIISSNDILNLKEIPASLLIIGGGVIGCEFASLFSSFGGAVTVVEKTPQLIPGLDAEASKKLGGIFRKKGIKVSTDTDAAGLNLNDYNLILVCVGRTPQTEGLGLERLGIKSDKFKIVTDEYLRTNIGNIYAAGDCTGKIMLAHFAAYEGRLAAENAAGSGNLRKADNANVPSCIFTDPEIAEVGLGEEEARERGISVNINKFDFMGSGMARILDETEGFVKIISDAKTAQVLGASIIGPKATELIGILTQAVSCHLKIPQIKDVIFAHPTLSESIKEALQ